MSSAPFRVVSGKSVVFTMFTFGGIATAVLWYFWFYHTEPFIPLQKAIASAYPGSQPRVDGGQRKMHADTPRLLWVVMRVTYHPIDDKPEAQATVDKVIQLARKHLDASEFDQINVRLFRGDPENQLFKCDFEVQLRTKIDKADSN
jgi:hypothetical protein